MPLWAVYGDGRRVTDGAVVAPRERLGWRPTIGLGMQHLLAVAAATLIVPALTGLSPAVTLLFSGIGTLAFLLITRHRLPAYLGSSVAFIAPLQAAQGAGLAAQLGGVLMVGLVLVAVGVAVKALGNRVVDAAMPPVVIGGIVMLIGLSLAPGAVGQFGRQPAIGVFTLLAVLVAVAVLPGMGGRLAILLGLVAGWLLATAVGALDPQRLDALGDAAWIGLPGLTGPQITPSVVLGMLPVVIVLVAENIGGVRAIGAITGRSTDGLTGDALVANGVATTLAGLGGGVGTTISPQNIGVMAASRVCSTATYAVAALAAIVLSFSPKVGALLLTVPVGVLGGASLVLYGLIAVYGAKVWMDNRVDLTDPLTLAVAAAALVAGVGGLTFSVGGVPLGGVVWGTAGIMLLYPLLRGLRRLAGARNAVPGTAVSEAAVPGTAVPGAAVPAPRLRARRSGGIGWQLGQK